MFYPTFIRSTGVGWGFGFGRIGAIAGTMLGGALIAAHWSFAATFAMASPPLLICCLAVLLMRWRIGAAARAGTSQTALAAGD